MTVSDRLAVGVLAAAYVPLVAARLHHPLLEPEEALYAELPREMLAAGRFVVPTLHGEPYLDKPPLLYWAVMGSYRLFGVHVWSARLAPALAAWLTVLVAYLWGKSVGGRVTGLACAAVLALTPDFAYRGPMLTPNGLLALCVACGLAAGHAAVRADRLRWGWWVASAVATGLGVLAKGPVAVVLVAAPLFAFARPGAVACLAHLGVAFAVAAPWFAAVMVRHPEFAEHFFWKHHVRRFADPFDHAEPFYFYLPQAALGGLPWAAAVGVAAWRFVRKRPVSALPGAPALLPLLAAAWAVLFFSLSGSKRPVYLVPVWPSFAVGVGVLLGPVLSGSGELRFGLTRRGWCVVGGVTAVVVAAWLAFWLPEYHRKFSLADAEELVAAHDPAVPVACYPHPWNSLHFRFPDRDVRSFREPELPQLVEHLRTLPRAVLAVKAGATTDQVLAALAGFDVAERADRGLVTVLAVRRKGEP